MTREQLEAKVLEYAEMSPAIAADLLDADPPTGPSPGSPGDAPSWCTCTNCRPMPTPREDVCCTKVDCLSRLPDIDITVLDPQVLRTAMRSRDDYLAEDAISRNAPLDDIHRCFRHAAYRQITHMRHGKLGAGDRRVIASCCVLRIRDRYPDSNGQYGGFISARI